MERNRIQTHLAALMRDDSGQTTTEYLMIVAAALALIVGALVVFGGELTTKAKDIVTQIFQ